jgi:hypothetical protein
VIMDTLYYIKRSNIPGYGNTTFYLIKDKEYRWVTDKEEASKFCPYEIEQLENERKSIWHLYTIEPA